MYQMQHCKIIKPQFFGLFRFFGFKVPLKSRYKWYRKMHSIFPMLQMVQKNALDLQTMLHLVQKTSPDVTLNNIDKVRV